MDDDDDSDSSRLVIDENTDRQLLTTKRRRRNPSLNQTRDNADQNIVNHIITEMRTAAPPINFAALIPPNKLKDIARNIDADQENIPTIIIDDDEQNSDQKRLTTKDFAKLNRFGISNNLSENMQKSELYSHLTGNHANLQTTCRGRETDMPENLQGLRHENETNDVSLLRAPEPSIYTPRDDDAVYPVVVYQGYEQSDLNMVNNEFLANTNPGTRFPFNVSVQRPNGQRDNTENPNMMVPHPYPWTAYGGRPMTKGSTNNHLSAIKMTNYSPATVTHTRPNQETYINTDASKQMYDYNLGREHEGALATGMYIQSPLCVCGDPRCLIRPDGSMNMGAAPKPLMPAPPIPSISSMYPMLRDARTSSMHPVHASIPMPYNSHVLRPVHCNGLASGGNYLVTRATYNNRNLSNIALAQHALPDALSRNSFPGSMRTETRLSIPNAVPVPATRPKPKPKIKAPAKKRVNVKTTQPDLPAGSINAAINSGVYKNSVIPDWDALVPSIAGIKAAKPKKPAPNVKTTIPQGVELYPNYPSTQPTSSNMSIETSWANIRATAYNMSNATSVIQAPLTAGAIAPPTNRDMPLLDELLDPAAINDNERAYEKITTVTSNTTQPLRRMHMGLEIAQEDNRAVSYGKNQTNGSVKSALNTEANLQLSRMSIEQAQGSVIETNVRATNNNMSYAIGDMPLSLCAEISLQSSTYMSLEQAQANISSADNEINTLTNSSHAPLTTNTNIQEARFNMSPVRAHSDIGELEHTMSHIFNDLQSLRTNMSIEQTQADNEINTIINNLTQAQKNTEDNIQSARLNISTERAQTNITIANNNINVVNDIPAPLNTDVDTQSSRTIMSVQQAQAHITTTNNNTSNITNQSLMCTEVNLNSARLNMSVEQVQANIRSADNKINIIANSLQAPLSTVANVQEARLNMSPVRAQTDIGEVEHTMSLIFNDLQPSRTNMSIEQAQAHNEINTSINNFTQAQKSTEDNIESARLNMNTERAQADISTTNNNISDVANNIPAPLNTDIDTQSSRTIMSVQQAQAHITTTNNNTSNITNETLLCTEVNLNSARLNMTIEQAQASIRSTDNEINIIANSSQAPLRTEANIQEARLNMSPVRAQYDIGEVKHPMSQIFNDLQSSRTNISIEHVQANVRRTNNNMSNVANLLESPLNTEDNPQTSKMNIEIEAALAKIVGEENSMSNPNSGMETLLSIEANSNQTRLSAKQADVPSDPRLRAGTQQSRLRQVSKESEKSRNSERPHDPINNEGYIRYARMNMNAHATRYDMRPSRLAHVQQARRDNNYGRGNIPISRKMSQRARVNRNIVHSLASLNTENTRENTNSYKVQVSTTSTTTQAISHSVDNNEFVQNTFSTETGIDAARTKLMLNQTILTKVTTEIVNKFSLEAFEIMQNVYRNQSATSSSTKNIIDPGNDNANNKSQNYDDTVTENVTSDVISANKTLENIDMTVNKCQNEAITNHRSENNCDDKKFEAARRRLARFTALQNINKEDSHYPVIDNTQRDSSKICLNICIGQNGKYNIQILPTSLSGSAAEQTKSHVNESEVLNKEITVINTKKPDSKVIANLEPTCSKYSYENSVTPTAKISIENDPKYKETTEKRPKINKESKEEEDPKPTKCVNSQVTGSGGNMAHIVQKPNLQLTATLIEKETENIQNKSKNSRGDALDKYETSFFVFQINFFRRVQEVHTQNDRIDFANELSFHIHNLIDISDDMGANADMEYKCYVCHNVAVYSPRRLCCRRQNDYLEFFYKTAQKCQKCLDFRKKYIAALNIYVETYMPEFIRNTGQGDTLHESQSQCVTTYCDTASQSKEKENTSRQNHGNYIIGSRNRSVITNDVSLTETKTDEHERHASSSDNTNTNIDHINKFIVNIPRNKLNNSIVQSHIENKNSKSININLTIVASNNSDINSNKSKNVSSEVTTSINSKQSHTNNDSDSNKETRHKQIKILNNVVYKPASNDTNKVMRNERKSMSTETVTGTNVELCDKNRNTAVNSIDTSKNKCRNRDKTNSTSSETAATTNIETRNINISTTANNSGSNNKSKDTNSEARKSIDTETTARATTEQKNININIATKGNKDSKEEKNCEPKKSVSADVTSKDSTLMNNDNEDKNKKREHESISHNKDIDSTSKNNTHKNVVRNRDSRKIITADTSPSLDNVNKENNTILISVESRKEADDTVIDKAAHEENNKKKRRANGPEHIDKNTEAIHRSNKKKKSNDAQKRDSEKDDIANHRVNNERKSTDKEQGRNSETDNAATYRENKKTKENCDDPKRDDNKSDKATHGINKKKKTIDDDQETDDDNESDDNESSDEESADEASKTAIKAAEDAYKMLKKNCVSSEETAQEKAKSKKDKIPKRKQIRYVYICNICTIHYPYSGSYLKHMSEAHGITDKKIPKHCIYRECTFCVRFVSRKTYNHHVKTAHPDIYFQKVTPHIKQQ